MPIFLIAIIAIFVLMKKNKKFPVLNTHKMRNDSMGQGHFGASRGYSLHKGVDLICKEGERVFAPINGTIRIGTPYMTGEFSLVEIKNSKQKVKLMYCQNIGGIKNGTEVKKGEFIALAQDISSKWGGSMIDHIHVELYEDGELTDPTNLLFKN